jgi:hypothetical protein
MGEFAEIVLACHIAIGAKVSAEPVSESSTLSNEKFLIKITSGVIGEIIPIVQDHQTQRGSDTIRITASKLLSTALRTRVFSRSLKVTGIFGEGLSGIYSFLVDARSCLHAL